MPKYSVKSSNILRRAVPELQLVCNELVLYFDNTVLCSYRDKAGQDAAVASGASKTPWPTSKHNVMPSRAVDLRPYFAKEPHLRWEKEAFVYMAGHIIMIAHYRGIKLRWGGDWNLDNDPADGWDWGHFEVLP